ncbi:hypothetical protein UF75_4510 [Desulfosporosinus sp. I2]|nr:hypothetical protein [Desulfosporosinus sp. I2]KJR45095.1 hypothetical protein UF75_4510 [Desulfosporosinus sp. I2]
MLELLASIMAELGDIFSQFESLYNKRWFKYFSITFLVILIAIIGKAIYK